MASDSTELSPLSPDGKVIKAPAVDGGHDAHFSNTTNDIIVHSPDDFQTNPRDPLLHANDTAVPNLDGKHSDETWGLILMALSSFAFSAMSLSVKVASGPGFDFPSFELVFVRSVFQMIGALIFLILTKRNPCGPDNMKIRWLLVSRGLAGSVGLALFYYSLSVMPLADTTVIFFTGPPFTAILSYFVLKEPISRWDIAALLSCLMGVVLVARPSFLFHDTTNDSTNHEKRLYGATADLIGAALSAIAYVSVRMITRMDSTVHAMVHVCSFGWVSTIFSPVGMFAVQHPRWPESYRDVGIMLGVGISGFIGQIMLNRGLQLGSAGPGTLMRNLDVVFAFIFGIFVLGEESRWTSFLGATLIVSWTLIIGLRKWHKSKHSSTIVPTSDAT